MQDIEILIRYKCEKCGGSGALRQEGRVIGNCRDCDGQGKKQEWVLLGYFLEGMDARLRLLERNDNGD